MRSIVRSVLSPLPVNTVTEPNANSRPVHVLAGVIRNASGEVLIARRHIHTHLGGLWEFPGGKLETGEDRFGGLVRELREELGIRVTDAQPLIQVPYAYPEKTVLLDVWEVQGYVGEVIGLEGQALQWVAPGELHEWPMPPADRPIVTAIRIPDRYLITPEPGGDREAFLQQLEDRLSQGIRLVQLRAKRLDDQDYEALAKCALAICVSRGATLLLNHRPEMAQRVGAHGVHLNSRRLRRLRTRPLDGTFLVAASCHTREELMHGQKLGLDFAVLGAVNSTPTHPDAIPLGWRQFADWIADIAFPVYALGGMSVADIETSRRSGGQGIAAIRSLW